MASITDTQFPITYGIADAAMVASVSAQLWRSPAPDEIDASQRQDAEEIAQLLATTRDNIEIEFNELAREWKRDRHATSSITEIVSHPSYLRIIELDLPAVPLILRELNKQVDHWFTALKRITGADPVLPEHCGKMRLMASDWLQWGRDQGYVR